ncbi:MAG: hypothetical protein AAFY56_13975 [Pseudomonadota bacterium]
MTAATLAGLSNASLQTPLAKGALFGLGTVLMWASYLARARAGVVMLP